VPFLRKSTLKFDFKEILCERFLLGSCNAKWRFLGLLRHYLNILQDRLRSMGIKVQNKRVQEEEER
jgi:hypothetical protein